VGAAMKRGRAGLPRSPPGPTPQEAESSPARDEEFQSR
jgi:hypothetical protein